MTQAGPLAPEQARRVEAWLSRRGCRWEPGPTFADPAGLSAEPAAAARLCEATGGDGYHREHVRTLRWAGDPSRLADPVAAALAWAGTGVRVEAESSPQDEASSRVLDGAGLALEVVLEAGGPGEGLHLWGRQALDGPGASGPPPPIERAPHAEYSGASDVHLVLHGPETREALREFLARLAPGRAYPVGTLLSPSETPGAARASDLLHRWALALNDGRVVGGALVLPDRRPGRERVGRVHVDISPSWRGHGVATRLLYAARQAAAEWGFARLEADPRSSHAAIRTALRNAGFEERGTQAGAWLLRGPWGVACDGLTHLSASPAG